MHADNVLLVIIDPISGECAEEFWLAATIQRFTEAFKAQYSRTPIYNETTENLG